MTKIAINSIATGKIPQGDPIWATFNDSFVNQDYDTIDIANAIYTGHSYTTWHTGRRKLENFVLGQHIAVDLDTQDYRSNIDYLMTHPLVRMYASILHTTPSHTDEAPRARILFLLDTPITNAEQYSTAAQFIMAQFDGCDTSTKDASRFFYGSKNCHLEWIDNILPLAILRRLYRLSQAHAPTRQARPAATSPKVIRLPSQDETSGTEETPEPSDLVRAIAALGKIDADGIDYRTWIGIIAAMKRDFGDDAKRAVTEWAKGKPGEVDREWQRLDIGRGGMTASTIFYMAAGGIR